MNFKWEISEKFFLHFQKNYYDGWGIPMGEGEIVFWKWKQEKNESESENNTKFWARLSFQTHFLDLNMWYCMRRGSGWKSKKCWHPSLPHMFHFMKNGKMHKMGNMSTKPCLHKSAKKGFAKNGKSPSVAILLVLHLLPRECKIRFQPTLPSFALESSISTVPIPQSLCFALFAISFFFHFCGSFL